MYGWDDQTVRETDRELARIKAEEENARAAAAAAGELEVRSLLVSCWCSRPFGLTSWRAAGPAMMDASCPAAPVPGLSPLEAYLAPGCCLHRRCYCGTMYSQQLALLARAPCALSSPSLVQGEEQYEDEADVGEPELVHEYDDHAVSDFTHAFQVRH